MQKVTKMGFMAEGTPKPLRPGSMLEDDLRVEQHLHRSKDADVYRVWSNTHRTSLVAKGLRPDRAEHRGARTRLQHEGKLLDRFAHPSIVRSMGTRPDRPLVVMEELQGRSLRADLAALGDAPWIRVCDIGIQLAAALHYLHRQDLIHADLKPANAFACDGGRVVLIDFSLTRPPGPIKPRTGTRQFASPEQVRGGDLGFPTDIWALGIILFRASTGTIPFIGDGFPQLEGRADSVGSKRGFSRRLVRAIDSCLDPDPGARPSAGELHEQLVDVRARILGRLTRPLD